jgi:glycosyltransferase involved in cell wall biosynthesis
MQPLVSIGMSVFNCERTLSTAIQSIVNQTYPNWELIIIDDGSQDRTLSIAKSFLDPRIKVITDGCNQRLPIRLNQAIGLSRGKYFARMDGDDISYPERLQRQVEHLEQHPEIDLLATAGVNFDRNGRATGATPWKQSHAEICARPWVGFPMIHPTWMGKLDWFQKFQYRPDAIGMEDYEIMLRAHQNSRFASLPDILLGYRVTSLSLKKILVSRYHLCISLIQKALTDHKWIFVYGVFLQVAKLLVEIVTVPTGLGLKLMKHRLGAPLEASDIDRWQQTWANFQREESAQESKPGQYRRNHQ